MFQADNYEVSQYISHNSPAKPPLYLPNAAPSPPLTVLAQVLPGGGDNCCVTSGCLMCAECLLGVTAEGGGDVLVCGHSTASHRTISHLQPPV